MDGSIAGVVVICAEARAHITVIGTSRIIQLAREALGWAKLRGMHAPRILNLRKYDANASPRQIRSGAGEAISRRVISAYTLAWTPRPKSTASRSAGHRVQPVLLRTWK